MKFWIALIAILLLLAPKAFAGDDPASDTTSPSDDEVTTYQGTGDHDPEIRQAIIAHLSHHHEVPDRKTLERVSDDARTIVFEIAGDDDAFSFHRQRAFRALAHWADDEIYELIVERLEDDDLDDGLRHHLLPVLADGFGEDALDDLEPFLFEADDPQIRMSAAHAIGDIDGDPARQLLRDALETEDNSVVERRLERIVKADD